ncbi:uncharacterized protein LOC121377366 [Gigantopelta aegis]|uniref:uncharacterized protein LOC121377366 n=1 Tax=Gigantopelta aegis TaxID=1735272 RepID=UPI001B8877D8|nr:uncharacterized protein LOC121377366 [Gigantopelta aegis]
MSRRRLILSVTVVLSACLVAVTSDRDISAVLTGSSAVGHEGGFYNFTCTVRNAAGFTDGVQFKKGEGFLMATLYQVVASCTKQYSSYRTSGIQCGLGTNNGSAQTKRYHMWIINLKKADVTLWWCHLPTFGVRSNILDITGLKIRINCSGETSAGQTTHLTCMFTAEVQPTKIVLYSPSGPTPEIASCDIAFRECHVVRSHGNYSAEFTADNKITLTIHAFDSERDAGIWKCTSGIKGDTCYKPSVGVVSCLPSNTSIMLQFIAIFCTMVITKNYACGVC